MTIPSLRSDPHMERALRMGEVVSGPFFGCYVPAFDRHTAVVRYIDRQGQTQEARFADWSAKGAFTIAWRFIRRGRDDGRIQTFRCFHVIADDLFGTLAA